MAFFDKALKYSYIAQKRERYKILKILMIFFVLFVIFNLISAYVLSVWVLDNNSMQPGLQPGDRFLVLSPAIPGLFSDTVPFERGNIVLLDKGQNDDHSWFLKALDSFVRFFTAQRISIIKKNDKIFIKRLIALPGDEISMTNYVLSIRPADSQYPLTEHEFSERSYDLNRPQVPALWDDSLPLSGNMDKITLGYDEYFVVSDDRLNSSDSRTWGPVRANEIIGRPLFRFWPFNRIGLP